jgi:hypothetical protein
MPDLRVLRPSSAVSFNEDTFRRVDAQDALILLVEQHGIERVHLWLERIANLKAEELPCRR